MNKQYYSFSGRGFLVTFPQLQVRFGSDSFKIFEIWRKMFLAKRSVTLHAQFVRSALEKLNAIVRCFIFS